jgi:two-component system, NtrC family, sensor histidine kinase HydH
MRGYNKQVLRPLSRGPVLTRRLSLKLLAPTVLVSLLLVGTCIGGAVYLNRLHLNRTQSMRENVASLEAARNLERSVIDLITSLRAPVDESGALARHIERRNERLHDLLAESEGLADTDPEREIVAEVRAGLTTYFARLQEQSTVSHTALADVLETAVLPGCRKLRNYNIDQVGVSDRDNYLIVDRLTWALLAVGFGAPVSGLLLGYAVARSLYQSMHQLSVRIRDAAGRLNSDLPPVVVEDLDDLPDLHRLMGGVVEEIEHVVQRLQQREREVLRADQLAAVGQVAAGVAHELRNPLTSVKMLVQAGLEGNTPGGLPPEDLSIIEHEVRRMETCIQTFLDFARPPASERRRCDLVPVIRRSLALTEVRARRQRVLLSVELPAAPVELDIDADQVHQVLVNLLLNALDALPQGGTIRVELRPPTPEEPAVAVRIRDSGPGIAPRIRERLFEPFVSSKETGLGLGLSISRRLVEAHGGTICGENAPGGGAMFAFTLPA